MRFLNNKYTRALTVVLLIQAMAFYAVASRPETVPPVAPLTDFPSYFGGWRMVQTYPVEKEIQEVLKADDLMSRAYANPSFAQPAYLFVAYFKTQRTGQSPHSPKNCLPGSGWQTVSDSRVPIAVPDWPAPIVINRYIVEHGDERSVTLYWYQSHNRVIASEFAAKFWAVADSLRYHRSDTALIRIVVEVRNNDIEGATQTGYNFVRSAFPEVLKQLPL